MFKQKKKILSTFLIIIALIITVGLGFLIISNLGTHTSTDADFEIKNKYSLNRTSAHVFNLTDLEEGVFLIKPSIEKFNYDENFIVATRIGVSDEITYWIIDMENDTTYGPMYEEDFETKKKELSVDLKLVDVATFFN